MNRLYGSAFLLVTAVALGCEGGGGSGGEKSSVPRASGATMAVRADADRPTIVFLGTSLTAGYGLDPDQAYPKLVQDKIDAAGLDYRVQNAGLSGETSAGAVRRIDWLFRQSIDVLVIETGANDGLRGQDPAQLRANIQAMIDRAKQQDPAPQILLLGMEAPPNLGRAYTRRFRAVYRELAQENGAKLVPFLLERVAGVESLNQADGMHPAPRGQAIMAETVWRVLESMLEQGEGSRE